MGRRIGGFKGEVVEEGDLRQVQRRDNVLTQLRKAAMVEADMLAFCFVCFFCCLSSYIFFFSKGRRTNEHHALA